MTCSVNRQSRENVSFPLVQSLNFPRMEMTSEQNEQNPSCFVSPSTMAVSIVNLVRQSAYFLLIFVIGYVFIFTIAASFVAANQERKIWKPKGLPSLSAYGYLKVFFFNVLWMAVCLIGCVRVLIRHVVTLGGTDVELEINRSVEDWVARIIIHWFVGNVKVVGRENLPEADNQKPAPVYICNHESQVDAAAVYFFDRRFKWVAKGSVVFLPGVGQVRPTHRNFPYRYSSADAFVEQSAVFRSHTFSFSG